MHYFITDNPTILREEMAESGRSTTTATERNPMGKIRDLLLIIEGDRLLVEDANSGERLGYVNHDTTTSAAFGRKVTALFEKNAKSVADRPKTDDQLNGEAVEMMSERNVGADTAVATVTLRALVARHMKANGGTYVDALRIVTRKNPELWARHD